MREKRSENAGRHTLAGNYAVSAFHLHLKADLIKGPRQSINRTACIR